MWRITACSSCTRDSSASDLAGGQGGHSSSEGLLTVCQASCQTVTHSVKSKGTDDGIAAVTPSGA